MDRYKILEGWNKQVFYETHYDGKDCSTGKKVSEDTGEFAFYVVMDTATEEMLENFGSYEDAVEYIKELAKEVQ